MKTKNQLKTEFPQLDQLAKLVEAKASQVNITSIRDYESIWSKHILDSLMALEVSEVTTKLDANSKVLDLGTGGGFPGLPLAITNPNSQFILVDSTRKKLDIVDGFAKELGLQNVETLWIRAGEDSHELKSQFDIVIARAVSYLPELIKLCQPFLKPNGLLVFYKQNNKEEIAEGNKMANKLRLQLKETYKYELDNSDRVILVYAAT